MLRQYVSARSVDTEKSKSRIFALKQQLEGFDQSSNAYNQVFLSQSIGVSPKKSQDSPSRVNLIYLYSATIKIH